MTLVQEDLKRLKAQCSRIIEVLREAGIAGCTNIELSDTVTKSLGARLSELYERGYYIECTKVGEGIYKYVLLAEPIKPLDKPMRAEELLLKQIEENYHGNINAAQLLVLLRNNDLMISRKSGAHKRKLA